MLDTLDKITKLSPAPTLPLAGGRAERSLAAPVVPLEQVVDLLGTPYQASVVAFARRTLVAGSPAEVFIPGLAAADPHSPLGLQHRLRALAQGAAGRPDIATCGEARALRAELAAFAAATSQPTGLRLFDISDPAAAAEVAFRGQHFDSLRLMRIAAAHMLARGDLTPATLGLVDGDETAGEQGVALLKISMVAIGELVYEEMGGGRPGLSRPAAGAGMEALRLGDVAAAGHQAHLEAAVSRRQGARGERLGRLTGALAGLDATGRLRLREATFARLMGRPVAAALLAIDAPDARGRAAQAQIQDAADRLAAANGGIALDHPAALNSCLMRVVDDLRASLAV